MAAFVDHTAEGFAPVARHKRRAAEAWPAQTSPGQTWPAPAWHMPHGLRPTEPAAPTRTDLLTSLVEDEILPRLVQARQSADLAHARQRALVSTEHDIAELTRLVLTEDAAAALAFVEALRLRGASAESLYLGVITDAARRLGEFWLEDCCDFAQVTIGTGRLQQVMRALSPHFFAAAAARPRSSSVLLLPAPGDQHTFGLVMLGDFFRRAGWHVAIDPGSDPAATVRAAWYDVAGFSIGAEARAGGLAACIRVVRRASCNRALKVMVGGPLFLSQPDLARRVGADFAAGDAPEAVRMADQCSRSHAAAH